MKLNQDISIVSLDAAFAVTKATELFIESLTKQSYQETVLAKKKTVQKKDLDKVCESTDALSFLQDAMGPFSHLEATK